MLKLLFVSILVVLIPTATITPTVTVTKCVAVIGVAVFFITPSLRLSQWFISAHSPECLLWCWAVPIESINLVAMLLLPFPLFHAAWLLAPYSSTRRGCGGKIHKWLLFRAVRVRVRIYFGVMVCVRSDFFIWGARCIQVHIRHMLVWLRGF